MTDTTSIQRPIDPAAKAVDCPSTPYKQLTASTPMAVFLARYKAIIICEGVRRRRRQVI